MIKSILDTLLFSMILTFASATFAEEASVRIFSPDDGAKLDAMAQNKISYEVVAGPKGDHTHLYLDGKEAAILRQLKGSHTFETLAAGSHEICIKVVNKNHTPIGVEKCIKVKVE